MRLVASRQLDGYPADIATLADEVVVLTSRDGATFLKGYDARLAPRCMSGGGRKGGPNGHGWRDGRAWGGRMDGW